MSEGPLAIASTLIGGGNVSANGIRQHYLHYGRGLSVDPSRPAVVLLPGITSPAATWGFVGERFGRSFDTYILDVRGRGLSSASSELDYSLEAQATDLVAFVEALGLSNWMLVGHSMGARIAARAAETHPPGLGCLVLVDPPVSGPRRRPYPGDPGWYAASIALSAKGCDGEALRAYCPTWTQEQLALRAEWLHTCDPRSVAASFEGFHTDDFHADLPAIEVRCLLMTAQRGDVVLDSDVEEIRRLNPGIEHRRVRDAGHMIPWDNAEGFYAAFGDFLGSSI